MSRPPVWTPPWSTGPPGTCSRWLVTLLDARPQRGGHPIPGLPPELTALPDHCVFAGRCRHVIDACRAAVPPPLEVPGGVARCLRVSEI